MRGSFSSANQILNITTSVQPAASSSVKFLLWQLSPTELDSLTHSYASLPQIHSLPNALTIYVYYYVWLVLCKYYGINSRANHWSSSKLFSSFFHFIIDGRYQDQLIARPTKIKTDGPTLINFLVDLEGYSKDFSHWLVGGSRVTHSLLNNFSIITLDRLPLPLPPPALHLNKRCTGGRYVNMLSRSESTVSPTLRCIKWKIIWMEESDKSKT